MTDIDQSLTLIAREGRREMRKQVLLGLCEVIFVIAGTLLIAALFAPPGDEVLFGLGLLVALTFARRVMADAWFQASEAHGQQQLMAYRQAASEAVVSRLPTASSGAIGALLIEGAEPVAARLGRYPALKYLAVVQPLCVLGAIAWLHWPIAAGILMTTPLIPLLMGLIGLGAKSASQKQVNELTRLGAHYLNRIRGMETLVLLGGGSRVAQEIEAKADRLRVATMGVLRLAFLTSAVLEFFGAISVALIAVYVGLSLLNLIEPLFGLTLTPVTGLAVLILAPEFYTPIRRLMAAWHDASEANSADEKMKAMLGHAPTTRMAPAGEPQCHDPSTVLELLDYQVGFSDETILLQPFHLSVRANTPAVLFGPSGSGKTQLLGSLLHGQHRQAGTLLWQGQPLTHLTTQRRHVAWMGQHQWFDAGSIRAQLTADFQADDAACEQVLRQVGLWTQLGNAPLERVLDIGGRGLSGGQLRRLGLARALIRRPRLLVLDEPTAHLDADACDALVDLIKQLTVPGLLICTHDARFLDVGDTYRIADRQVVVA
ncbi:MAG: ATP-binding cassette domain-containing protein [Gammaproteobacteria bacterium]|nr:ATP-binding cassette domain-containing protein [Gammaproteobacteria bacterium]